MSVFELLPNEILVTVLFQYLSIVQVWSLFRADPRLLINKLSIDFVRQLQRRRFQQLYFYMQHETPIIFAGLKIWGFLHRSMYEDEDDATKRWLREYLIYENPNFMNQDNLLLREMTRKSIVSTATQRMIQSSVSLQNVLFDVINGRLMFGDYTAFRCNLQRKQICNLNTADIIQADQYDLPLQLELLGSHIRELGYVICWTFDNQPGVWPSNGLPPWHFIFKDMQLRSGTTLKCITPLKT